MHVQAIEGAILTARVRQGKKRARGAIGAPTGRGTTRPRVEASTPGHAGRHGEAEGRLRSAMTSPRSVFLASLPGARPEEVAGHGDGVGRGPIGTRESSGGQGCLPGCPERRAVVRWSRAPARLLSDESVTGAEQIPRHIADERLSWASKREKTGPPPTTDHKPARPRVGRRHRPVRPASSEIPG